MRAQKRYEWIDQYLSGKMSGKELSRFEKKMAREANFSKEVTLHRKIWETFRAIKIFKSEDLLLESRLQLAMELLKSKSVSFSEVWRLLGFSSRIEFEYYYWKRFGKPSGG